MILQKGRRDRGMMQRKNAGGRGGEERQGVERGKTCNATQSELFIDV